MKRLISLVAATFLLCPAAGAHPQFRSISEWTWEMVRRLPFSPEGILTREAYEEVSRRYIDQMTRFHTSLAQTRIEKAIKSGRPALVTFIEKRRDQQLEIVKHYAAETAQGVMKTLDPDGKGYVELNAAVDIINRIASLSDFNDNGVLEPNEASVAEAAVVRGFDVRDENALDKLLFELDREMW